jgi:hypothetical protein
MFNRDLAATRCSPLAVVTSKGHSGMGVRQRNVGALEPGASVVRRITVVI